MEVLRQEQQKRWQQCHREIQAVLAKYGCMLVGQPTITPDGRISANVAIVDAKRGE